MPEQMQKEVMSATKFNTKTVRSWTFMLSINVPVALFNHFD